MTKENIGIKLVRQILLLNGFWMWISSILYAFWVKPDTDMWFSMFCMSVGSFAFWAIIKSIQESHGKRM